MSDEELRRQVDAELSGLASPTMPRTQAGGHPCPGIYRTPKASCRRSPSSPPIKCRKTGAAQRRSASRRRPLSLSRGGGPPRHPQRPRHPSDFPQGERPGPDYSVGEQACRGWSTRHCLPRTKHDMRGCARYLAESPGQPAAQDATRRPPRGDIWQEAQTLRDAVAQGAALHNADLDREEYRIVDEKFRRKSVTLLVIVATTTLAAGINTPASSVVIAGDARAEHGYLQRYVTGRSE